MLDSAMFVLGLGFSRPQSPMPMPAIGYEGVRMIYDYSFAGLVTAGLLAYLTYALLRPERF
ncbi:MAG TPA: K(+)-transporting ATPase subunit F [Aestuariivirgaceae bacterium]|jgi:K+-transporting ATPase ATPase F chain